MTFCNNLREKKNPYVFISMEQWIMKLWLKTSKETKLLLISTQIFVVHILVISYSGATKESNLCSSEFLYTSVKSILRLASFAADVTSNIQVAGL